MGGYSGPNFQLVDNEPVDMFHGNGGHLRYLFFDVAGGGTRIFLHKPFQDLPVTAGDDGRMSTAFFSLRDGTGREGPSFGEEPFDGGAAAAKAVSDNHRRHSLLSPRHNPCFIFRGKLFDAFGLVRGSHLPKNA